MVDNKAKLGLVAGVAAATIAAAPIEKDDVKLVFGLGTGHSQTFLCKSKFSHATKFPF